VSGETFRMLLPIEGLDGSGCLRGAPGERAFAKAEKRFKGLAGRLATPIRRQGPPRWLAECRANLAEARSPGALAREAEAFALRLFPPGRPGMEQRRTAPLTSHPRFTPCVQSIRLTSMVLVLPAGR